MNYRVIFRDRVANNISSMTFLTFELGLDPLVVTFEVFEGSSTVMIYEAVYYPRQRL